MIILVEGFYFCFIIIFNFFFEALKFVSFHYFYK